MPGNQEIKGNTLKVYLYLVKHGPSDLKDIQHGLGLSSASLGSYHLGKLSEAGMVTQDAYGKYSALKDASDKILEGYSKVGPAIVPQLFFFSLLFTILVIFFSITTINNPSFTPYLVAISIAMIAVLWFETVRLWRRLSV
ncbi:MAG TPA: helix-turn-helix domain-containing protein [Candidatus Acidoferrales bacterium]|nr:helix-turn-helix domain-containing protein [Candidatus Acidoferrales bacterium]